MHIVSQLSAFPLARRAVIEEDGFFRFVIAARKRRVSRCGPPEGFFPIS